MPSLISSSLIRRDTIAPRSILPFSASATNRGKSRRIWASPTTDPARRLPEKTERSAGRLSTVVLGGHAHQGHRSGGPGHVEGLHHELGTTDHLEAVVDPASGAERPHLVDHIIGGGIAGLGSMAWVAPIRRLVSRRPGAGSMAMMVAAPAMAAPWMTDWPTPPQPMTATLDPGATRRC